MNDMNEQNTTTTTAPRALMCAGRLLHGDDLVAILHQRDDALGLAQPVNHPVEVTGHATVIRTTHGDVVVPRDRLHILGPIVGIPGQRLRELQTGTLDALWMMEWPTDASRIRIRTWVQDEEISDISRTMGIGVVSDTYRPIPSAEILDSLPSKVREAIAVRARVQEISPERVELDLRCTDRTHTIHHQRQGSHDVGADHGIIVGPYDDVYHAGVSISWGDVGQAAVRFSEMLHRQWCANRAVYTMGGETIRIMHRGRGDERGHEDRVRNALGCAANADWYSRIQQALQIQLREDWAATWRTLAVRPSRPTLDAIDGEIARARSRDLLGRDDVTLWDVWQALSRRTSHAVADDAELLGYVTAATDKPSASPLRTLFDVN